MSWRLWFAAVVALLCASCSQSFEPALTGASFDASNGNLTLFFDTLVSAESLNASCVSLQDASNLATAVDPPIYLSGAYNSLKKQGNTSALQIILHSTDFAKVALSSMLGKSQGTTFVALRAAAVLSSLGNASLEVSSSAAWNVDSYRPDTLPPFFAYYHLDMDVGLLNLTFSEPVNVSSFHLTGLSFHRTANTRTATAHTRQSCALQDNNNNISSSSSSSILSQSNYLRSLAVSLGEDNVNCIKSQLGLCLSRETCHLSASSSSVVQDLASNPLSLVAFDSLHGVPPRQFRADLTPPHLLAWDFDRSPPALLSLTFSKPVDLAFFNFTGLTLTNNNGLSLRVAEPVRRVTAADASATVKFQLSAAQELQLQQLGGGFLSQPQTSFLVLDAGLVVDTSPAQHKYSAVTATAASPLRVRRFGNDTAPPQITGFSLHVPHGVLRLAFSEAVDVSSWDVTALTLQSVPSLGRLRGEEQQVVVEEVVSFLPQDVIVIVDPAQSAVDVLEVNLTSTGVAKVASCQVLGQSPQTTFLAARRSLIRDTALSPNALVEISTARAMAAREVTPDTSAPELVRWTADLTQNVLSLTFSRPVVLAAVQTSGGRLGSEEDFSLAFSRTVSLTTASVLPVNLTTSSTSSSLLSTNITLLLSEEIVQTLKSVDDDFCTSIDNCYLSLATTFARGRDLYPPSSSSSPQPGRPIIPIANPAQSASVLVPDTVPPRVSGFSLDASSGLLSLQLTTAVLSPGLNFTALTLTGNGTGGRVGRLRLSAWSVADPGWSSLLRISLLPSDLRVVQTALTSQTTTTVPSLSVTSTSLRWLGRDVAGNAVAAAEDVPPLLVVPDTSRPVLQMASLSEDGLNLTLAFSKHVSQASVNLSCLALAARSGRSLPLTGATLLPPPHGSNSTSRLVRLSLENIRSVLTAQHAARSQADCFVYLARPACLTDATAQRLSAEAMAFSQAVRDGLRGLAFRLDLEAGYLDLLLAAWPLERGGGRIAAVDARGLSLVQGEGRRYTLTAVEGYELLEALPSLEGLDEGLGGGEEGDCVVRVRLSPGDVSSLPVALSLDSKHDLQLEVRAGAVVLSPSGKEMSSDQVLACSLLVTDRSSPRLTGYILDLATGRLGLSFHRDVAPASLTTTRGLLSFAASNSTNSEGEEEEEVTLQGAAGLDGQAAAARTVWVSLQGGQPLTYRERLLRLFSNQSATATAGTALLQPRLSARKGVVYTVSFPRKPSEAVEGMSPREVVPDGEAPTVTGFSLDLTRRLLAVTFSEAIDPAVGRLHLAGFVLLEDPADEASAHVALSSASMAVSSARTRSLVVRLGERDVDAVMMLAPRLATNASRTFLAVAAGSFQDLALPGNPNTELYYRYALPVTSYLPDTLPPVLLQWNLSLVLQTMDLYFSEVVDCHSLRGDRLLLQARAFLGAYTNNNNNADETTAATQGDADSVWLSSSSQCAATAEGSARYSRTLRVRVSAEDLLRVQRTYRVAKQAENAFLRLAAGAVRDVFGNENDAVQDGGEHVLLATRFESDTTSPYLLAYTLTATQSLVLFFNEPVDVSTLKVTWITLQDDRTAPVKSYRLMQASLFRTDRTRRRVEILLHGDIHRITTDSQVTQAQTATFLSLDSRAIRDMAGNAVRAIAAEDAKPIGPSVLEWDLDLNAGVLSLHFSSAVSTTFSMVGFTLQDAQAGDDADHVLPLTTSALVVSGANATWYRSSLSILDLHQLKQSGMMTPQHVMPLYLVMEAGLTTSLDDFDALPGLTSTAVEASWALRIREYTPDTTTPQCLSFGVDLTAGELRIVFDEPVQVDPVVLTGLTLFSSANGSHVSLTSATDISLEDHTELVIAFSLADLNRVKLAVHQGGLLDRLVVQAGAVRDMAGNLFPGNTPDTPILLDTFVADSSPPVLTGFEVDLSTYSLVAVFDELVDVSAFTSLQITLLNNVSIDSTPWKITLTEYTLLDQPDDRKEVLRLDLSFLRADQFALEAIDDMFNSLTDSYLAVSSAKDIFGNTISTTQIVQATSFVGRTQKVDVEGFDFDDQGNGEHLLTVYWSATMDIAQFHCSDLVLVSSAESSPSETVSLLDTDCTLVTSTNNRIVSLTIASSLLSSTSIGQARSSTYLHTASSPQSVDVYGNAVQTLLASHAHLQGPRILRAWVDLQVGEMMLVFNKEMDMSSLPSLSTVGLYSTVVLRAPVSYYLQSSMVSAYGSDASVADSVAWIMMGHTDLNAIKALDMQYGKAYVLIEDNSFVDTQGLTVATASTTDGSNSPPLFISRLIADRQRPRLLTVTVDMGTEEMVFTFNEPVRPASFQPSGWTLQSAADGSDSSTLAYHLTGGTLTLQGTSLVLVLSHADASQIKCMTGLFNAQGTSFLSSLYGSLADFAGNFVDAIPATAARGVDYFVDDIVDPVLETFTLDLSESTGRLLLYFSEPVQAANLDVTTIVLQSRFGRRDGSYYQLTGGNFLIQDSDVIVVSLLYEDLLAMKLLPGLIRRRQSTYIVCPSTLAQDTWGNALVAIEDLYALPCGVYIPDRMSPQILSIQLDLNLDRIAITLDEPVNISSVDATGLQFQPNRSVWDNITSSEAYRLSSFSVVIPQPPEELALQVVIQLHSPDLDNIRLLPGLARNASTTFFTVYSSLVKDFAGNGVQEAFPSEAIPCTVFVVDETSPTVVAYHLDMDKGEMFLDLSEPVELAKLNTSQLILQNEQVRRFDQFENLSESLVEQRVSENGTRLAFAFPRSLQWRLKSKGIGTSLISSYLSWNTHFAKDREGNIMPPAYDASVLGHVPRLATSLIVDRTSPLLLRWWVDRSEVSLHLLLDEPVLVHSTSSLRLQHSGVSYVLLVSLPSILYTESSTHVVLPLQNYCFFPSHPTVNLTALAEGAVCPSGKTSFYSVVQPTSSSPWGLSILSDGAIRDRAASPNPMASTVSVVNGEEQDSVLIEGSPDCSPCNQTGQFVASNCTSGMDRQCAHCRTCSPNTYQYLPCSAYQDTVCAVCSTCTLGYFVQQLCGPASDTLCAPCTTCGMMEYVARPCAYGRDTLCASCHRCDFGDDRLAQQQCESHPPYFRWADANCCKVQGKKVLCNALLNKNNAAKLMAVDISGTEAVY